MSKPKLLVMVGLSACGKSSIAKEIMEKEPYIVVSSDAIRGEICEGGVIDQSKNEEVFKIFHKRIKDNLLAGENVITDATNITMKARRSLLENVKKIDCEKIAYIIPKPVEQCIEDNIYKEYPVPHHVIQKQMMNFQIPFYEEGWDQILVYRFNTLVNESFIWDCEIKMKSFDQKNPHHNATLGKHCEVTANEFLFNTWCSYHLYAGARLHDIGKLFTQKLDDNGVAHYYQHENVGAYYLLSHINDLMMYNYDWTEDTNAFLEMIFLVNYHMMPMNWNSEKARQKWRRRFGDKNYEMLLNFHVADKVR